MRKDIAAAIIAIVCAASVYWFLDRTHWVGEVVHSIVGDSESWFVVYFLCMALASLVVLIGVARAVGPTTWVYPALFGLLGLLWHSYDYNFFHAGAVAGVFGNGFFFMAAILFFVLTKCNKPLKADAKKRRGLAER